VPNASAITALIVTHDSAGVLPACLGALAREGVPALVVDNASTDNTVALAEAAGARVIRNARNEGYGRANTLGVKALDTTWFLLLNPDVEMQPGAVAALLEAAARYADAGMIAPRIVEPDGRLFYQNRSLLMESVLRRAVAGDARALQPSGDACAPSLSGACFLMRRDVFLDLGGFDPNIFLFYEDDDLCRRLADAGRALVHVDGAEARHLRGASATPNPARRFKTRWHFAWSRVYIARKYGLPTGAAETLLKGFPKALLSLFSFRPMEMARHWGSIAGTLAALSGRTALMKEGLAPADS